MIFLHGWVGSWRYWSPSMQELAAEFRSYALDFYGFGDSAHAPTHYSLEKQIRLLDFFLQELGIGKAALVGHGMGALTALLFALRYPGAVDRLMTVALPFSLDNIHNRIKTDSPKKLADWLIPGSPAAQTARADGLKADPSALPANLDPQAFINLIQRTCSLSLPCLLTYGSRDPALRRPDASLASLPKNFQYLIFEDTAHFPMLEHPAEFNRLLRDFLTLQPGDSPRILEIKKGWERRVR